MDLGERLPPNNPRLPHQLGQDWGSPSSAPTAPQPSNPGVRETKSRGRPRRRGGQGPQAQLKWPVGGDSAVPPNRKEKHPGPQPLGPRSPSPSHCFTASQSFSRIPRSGPAPPQTQQFCWGPRDLQVRSGKIWGWNQRDLIKALTACRAVTRYGGQPEKVDIYLCPHLTYRPVPAWRVVSGTARGNPMARTMAPLSSDSL